MRTKILTTLTLLFLLAGCQNSTESQAEHDAKIAAQAKAELRAELKQAEEAKAKKQAEALKKENKLAHIGITSSDGKLIIDTNKTKNYFQKLAEKLKAHADKFAKDFNEGKINDPQAGVVVTDTQINIDLNKTKSFLDTWGKTIEAYAKEFQKMTEELNSSK